MKTLLYIEEKEHVRENFLRMVNGVGFFNVLTAANVNEAFDITRKLKADIIIAGRQITVEEVEILDRYLKDKPDIKLIVMMERNSKVAKILKAYEYKIQFEMPADTTLLLETLLEEFESNCGGQLRGISLSSFLQMIELEVKSCVVKVMEKGRAGFLYCQSGALIDAEIGDLKGKEAALAILEMENSLIHIDYNMPQKERTIVEPLMGLLLESGRKRDEKILRPEQNRRYKRFDCALPIQFFYDEKTERGVIRDISVGGFYLKTSSAIPVGKKIQVALFSPSLEKGCKIDGIIVRTGSEGVGAKFLPKSMQQLGILRTVIIESQVAYQEAGAHLPAEPAPPNIHQQSVDMKKSA